MKIFYFYVNCCDLFRLQWTIFYVINQNNFIFMLIVVICSYCNGLLVWRKYFT